MNEIKGPLEMVETHGPKSTENFVESYGAFTRVVNQLQRKYLELKEESSRQSTLLEEANKSLRKMSIRNRAVTEFLNSVFGSVAAGIIVIDKSGKITHLNGFSEKLFSVSRSNALGCHYDSVIPKLSPRCPSALTALEDNPGWRRSSQIERLELGSDGINRVFLTSATQMRNENDEVFGAVEVFHDVSDLREMEREISHMEGLASIGRMAATVAHQIRNPLVSVKGFASLLARDLKSDDENHARAEKILRGVENLERVIDALLTFSRHEKLIKRPTNMNRYLKKVVRQFNDRNGSDANSLSVVAFSGSDTKLEVDLDQLVFREALENMMRNAMESTSRGVRVTVTIAKDSDDNSKVRITISDDGPGMGPEVMSKIFSPFFTTKTKGAGLGLPLSRKLVMAHGGELDVESTPGRGSIFIMKLPRYQRKESSAKLGAASAMQTDKASVV